MIRNALNLVSQKFCLLLIITLFLFGCASPKQNISSDFNPNRDGLAYAKNVKGDYSRAWNLGTKNESPTKTISVLTKVVIAKDGKVESAKIVKSSGDKLVDESVQRTLDQVKFVPPFEAGAKDERRTFSINFNLEPKSN